VQFFFKNKKLEKWPCAQLFYFIFCNTGVKEHKNLKIQAPTHIRKHKKNVLYISQKGTTIVCDL
jgi:hypothetical protein